MMLKGALDADAIVIFAVLLSSTLLNAAYFVPIVYQGFFGKPQPHGDLVVTSQIKEAPLTLVVPLTITALISLGIGFYPYFFLQFAEAVLP
jgi:multicomponent Na+:H+ antiporter subunit D